MFARVSYRSEQGKLRLAVFLVPSSNRFRWFSDVISRTISLAGPVLVSANAFAGWSNYFGFADWRSDDFPRHALIAKLTTAKHDARALRSCFEGATSSNFQMVGPLFRSQSWSSGRLRRRCESHCHQEIGVCIHDIQVILVSIALTHKKISTWMRTGTVWTICKQAWWHEGYTEFSHASALKARSNVLTHRDMNWRKKINDIDPVESSQHGALKMIMINAMIESRVKLVHTTADVFSARSRPWPSTVENIEGS